MCNCIWALDANKLGPKTLARAGQAMLQLTLVERMLTHTLPHFPHWVTHAYSPTGVRDTPGRTHKNNRARLQLPAASLICRDHGLPTEPCRHRAGLCLAPGFGGAVRFPAFSAGGGVSPGASAALGGLPSGSSGFLVSTTRLMGVRNALRWIIHYNSKHQRMHQVRACRSPTAPHFALPAAWRALCRAAPLVVACAVLTAPGVPWQVGQGVDWHHVLGPVCAARVGWWAQR